MRLQASIKQTNPKLSDLMTVEELSEYLKMSKSTIYKLIFKKQIPHYKPTRGTVWFRFNEIQIWLQEGKVSNFQTTNNPNL